MSDRFYTPQPLAVGDFTLDGPEAHHMTGVRRFAPGDAVTLFNGDGHEYPAVVESGGRKSVTLTVTAAVEADREATVRVTVAAALPKGDRADFLVEKLTELGVARFVPLVTTRSIVVPKLSTVEKMSRLVIEASKQCGRNRLMEVAPPTSWRDYLASATGRRYLLHTADGTTPTHDDATELSFAVGPEGGFTPEEVAAAVAAGFVAVSFGPRVLRVETAAVVAAAWAIQPA
jgi:16S rRNA (uracil1498-N3)-methyltransferase